MLTQVLDPSSYTLSLYSIPTFVTAVAILLLGLLALARERVSRVTVSFALVTLAAGLWLFCFSWVYSSVNPRVALWWIEAGYLGVPFIPSSIYYFTVSVLGTYEEDKKLVAASWLTSGFFSILTIASNSLVTGVYHYSWGYYAKYGWVATLFLTYFTAMLLLSMYRYIAAYRTAQPGVYRLRIKWLVIAFAIGYAGSVDYIPAYGVPLYPFGYLPILGFLAVSVFAVWKYRLVDITPAFAARQIIETMNDALIVYDPQGFIKLANRAAGELLGHAREDLINTRVTDLVESSFFTGLREQLHRDGKVHNYETAYRLEHGVLSFLSLSATVMKNEHGEAIATLCIARDITERIQAQERLQRQLQRVDALHNIDVAITSSHDLPVTLDVILDQVASELHVDAADVLLLDPYTQTLEYTAGRGFRFDETPQPRQRLDDSYAGWVALNRQTLRLPEVSQGGFPLPPGFVSYCAVPLLVKEQVKGVLEVFHRSPLEADPEWLSFLEAIAGQAAVAIDNAELFEQLQCSNSELVLAYDRTLEGWSRALDLRDRETEGHTQRVTEMTMRLARTMGIGEGDLVHMRRGALLHDIGKVGIPDAILHKPGPLTDDEWEIMRRHPSYAYDLLSPIAFLRPALDIPYCHHEKWDGSGYPRALKGEKIPLSARIFAVVDVWDALCSDRPYRRGWPQEKVLDYISSLSGAHFDPEVVAAFGAVMNREFLTAAGRISNYESL